MAKYHWLTCHTELNIELIPHAWPVAVCRRKQCPWVSLSLPLGFLTFSNDTICPCAIDWRWLIEFSDKSGLCMPTIFKAEVEIVLIHIDLHTSLQCTSVTNEASDDIIMYYGYLGLE